MSWLNKRSKVWYLFWREEGKIRKKRVSIDHQTAKAYKANFDNARYSGDLGLIEKKKSFKEFFDEYIKYSESNKSKRTKIIDENALRNFMKIVNPVTLARVNARDFENYKQTRSESVESVSVNIELRAIKAAFAMAVKWKYIKENPAKSLKKLPVIQQIRFLERDEVNSLLNACDDLIKPIVQIFLYTGMRMGK